MKNPINIGIYCRVSTESQAREGQSLDVQKSLLSSYASARFPDSVPIVFSEIGSARRTERHQYKRMMQLARAGRLKAILCVELSRLWRNIQDAIQDMSRLRESNVDLVILNQGIDTSTPYGRLSFAFIAALAAFESEQTSERVKRAHRELREQGRKGPGRRPFGWVLNDSGLLCREESEQRISDLILGLRGEGRSWNEIAEHLNKENLKTSSGLDWVGQGVRLVIKSVVRRRSSESEGRPSAS